MSKNQSLSPKLLLFIKRYGFPIFTALLLISLFTIAIFNLVRESRTFADEVVAQDIQALAAVFERIDTSCSIVEFEHQKSYIDFLTVQKFVGDEVGAMHLLKPQNWQGPYLRENPKVFGKPFLIVRTKKGYFIVPPIGLRLSNGFVISDDVLLDKSADIEKLCQDPKGLRYKDKPLAAKISTSGNSNMFIEEIAASQEEDNEAG